LQATFDYIELLQEGDAKGIAREFAGEPVIHDPRSGRVAGREALERFVAETSVWLDEHSARGMLIAATKNEQREVQEWVVNLDIGEDGWNLPIAVVLDRAPGGIGEMRVYHSLWPLTGSHKVRPPLLTGDPSIALEGAPGDYQRALAAGDVEGILASYEPDATTREPSGGPYSYVGADNIRKIYTMMFSNGGGIPLEFCTATDDGTACAIEYNAVRWGRTEIPPQAGVAVYVRGRTGRLAAARIYDDVEPPQGADSSA
jgi:SnoaL-like domain